MVNLDLLEPLRRSCPDTLALEGIVLLMLSQLKLGHALPLVVAMKLVESDAVLIVPGNLNAVHWLVIKGLAQQTEHRASKAKKGMHIGTLIRSWSRSKSRTGAQVKGRPERATNSGNTLDDACAIDGTATPINSVRSLFNKDDVRASVLSADSDSFIKAAVKIFDSNCLVVAGNSDMDIDVEDVVDTNVKETLQGAAVINDDKTT